MCLYANIPPSISLSPLVHRLQPTGTDATHNATTTTKGQAAPSPRPQSASDGSALKAAGATGGAPAAQSFSFLSLLTDWNTAKLALLACIWGFGNGINDNFLFLYLDELKTPPSLMGLSLTINTAMEVPVFLYSGAILKRLGSTGTFHLVLAAYVVRLAWYSWFFPLTHLVWGSLLAEPLHGITFALAWSAILKRIKETVPPSYIATVSSIVSACWWGISFGVGAAAGGAMYASYGPVTTFRLAAGIVMFGWGVYAFLDTLLGSEAPGHHWLESRLKLAQGRMERLSSRTQSFSNRR